MIKRLLHIILIIIIASPAILMSQYTLDNTGGKLNNMGTIRVKNGQTKALPDTLGGRIEFLQMDKLSQQVVPNIVYNQLMIGNTALKLISDERKDGGVVRSMVVMDSLIVSDTADFTNRWIGLNSEEVRAKSTIKNTARYSSSKDLVIAGESKAQDLLGDGHYTRVRLENPFGADVRGGGFKVEQLLTLKKGDLRNAETDNFYMFDSSRIIRHVGSSIAYEPGLVRNISVHYEGDGGLTTGAEIPTDKKSLSNLYVNVSGNVILDRNVYVQDTLYVGADIAADTDTLVLEGALNPIFTSNPNIEISGHFRRNTLLTGDTILLNSPFIWAYFVSDAAKMNLSNLISTVRPRTFHSLPNANEKAIRAYTLAGVDSQGMPVQNGFSMSFGYGWRDIKGSMLDESNNLVPEQTVLQRWVNTEWIDILPKELPSLDFGTGWATGIVEQLNDFGDFAIGMPGGIQYAYTFRANFYLEGPYKAGSRGFMTHELWDRDLIRAADLAMYPTNLDASLTSDFLSVIPDSVVDIVVLEFRKERNSVADLIKTAYLRKDGTLIDRNGNSSIQLHTTDGIDPQGGKYHVAVRHRNHAAVITEIPIDISKTTADTVYRLSDPNMIEGGTASLKLVDVGPNGERYYALKGGFMTEDVQGLANQMNFVSYYTRTLEHQNSWKGFTTVGYYNADFNLSGIMNTKDFNITWNNRLAK